MTNFVTREYVESAPLPNYKQSYKVISHKYAITNVIDLLNKHNFSLIKETYKANKEANNVQCIFNIKHNESLFNDEDLGLMFAFGNSYNKQTKFKCAIGAYVFVCDNGMISGDINYSRKHTGTADIDILEQIENQIIKAGSIFNRITNDKNEMKKITLTLKQQCELSGVLYLEKEIISSNQLSIIKLEMKNPSYNYNVDRDNLWSYFNHVTHALKKDHPKNWIETSRNFHNFITNEFLSNSYTNNLDTVNIPEDIFL